MTWLDGLVGDVRFAVRILRKRPGFTVSVVLTLALGLGVNTALFTVFDAFALRPLPLPEAERLVNVAVIHPRDGNSPTSFSYPDYLDYRAQNHVFADLIATHYSTQSVLGDDRLRPTLVDDSRSVNFVPVWYVSDNYFSALRPEMALGLPFVTGAGVTSMPGAVIVLSYRFWQGHFDADAAVVGKTLWIDSHPLTIIGVAAPDFVGLGLPPRPAVGWIPLAMHRDFAVWIANRRTAALTLFGRLAPGGTPAQAAAEMQALQGQIAPPSAGGSADDRIVVWSAGTLLPEPPGTPWPAVIILLMIAFAIVMMIVCANVVNLLLAEAAARQHEIAVRLAAGATRGRLVRQLLTETLLLSLLGGVAGLILATWTLQALYGLVMSSAAVDPAVREWLVFNLSPDVRVFGLVFLLVGIAALAIGVAPALAASRVDVTALLQGGGSLFSGRVGQSRLRSALVVLQVALSLTLLLGAGLLVSSLRRQTADVGFDPRPTLVLLPVPPKANNANAEEWRRFVAGVETKLAGVPGVAGVGRANFEVLRTNPERTGVAPGGDDTPAGDAIQVPFGVISSTYLATLGVPLLRGRMFTSEEAAAGASVGVVSDSLARRLWPGQVALGQRLRVDPAAFNGGAASKNTAPTYRTCEVIGVVGDAIYGQILDTNPAFLFLPWSAASPVRSQGASFLVRTEGDPRAMMGRIRTAVEESGGLLLQQTPLSQSLEAQRAPAAAAALLSGAVGLLGLAVAAVGLFGVVAFNVNRRTREIGIRAALGAAPRAIVRTFVGQGMRPVALGLGIGLGGGFAISRLMASALNGVRPLDAATFCGVPVFLAAVAWLACWLAARRAAQVDPIVVLRS